MTHCLICGKEALQFVCKECEAKVVERSNGHKRALEALTAENKALKVEINADKYGSKHYKARIVELTEENEKLKKLKMQGLPGCPQCRGCGWCTDSTEGGITILCDCVGSLVAKRLKECNPHAAQVSKVLDAVGEWTKDTGKYADSKLAAVWAEYRLAFPGGKSGG